MFLHHESNLTNSAQGPWHCSRKTVSTSKDGGHAVDSVRGYEMKPAQYKSSATDMARLGDSPSPALATFRSCTVSKAGGGRTRSNLHLTSAQPTPDQTKLPEYKDGP